MERGKPKNLIPHDQLGRFDILIASHVIEHFPDPISVLVAAESLLRPDTGLISLAVPDKRLCFGFFRPLSTTGKFLAAYRDSRSRHSAADLFDSVAYLATMGPDIAWGWRSTDAVKPLYSLDDAYQKFRHAGETVDHEYEDCNGWTFTPASFELLILELSALGVLDWHIQRILPQNEEEFIVHLARGRAIFESGEALEKRLFELMKEIQRELYKQAQYYLAEEATFRQKIKNVYRAIWQQTVPVPARRRVAQLRGKI